MTRGFTLIETAATLMVISLIAVGLVGISDYLLNKSQIEMTTDHLNELRRAISGNPVIVLNEARTSFGYLGDMGSLPAQLEDLWVKGSQPDFVFDTAKKTGAGWNGPYLEVGTAELASSLPLDGWGNSFVYSAASFSDATFGATVLGKILSRGADLSSETADDVSVNFFQSEIESRVQGFVKDNDDNAVPGVAVTVNYAQNGVLTSQSAQTDGTGYYAVSNVPFGNRSVTIEPKLVLAPDTTVVSGNNNQNIQFTINNFANLDIAFTSITVNYTIVPDAWFSSVKVGNDTVFNTTPRLGNGDTVTFSQKSVTGTGQAAESVQIRLQSPVTDVADLVIGDIGKGGLLVIEFNGFNSAETGAGTDVDVIGVSFEVIFKNASNQVVGTVVVQP